MTGLLHRSLIAFSLQTFPLADSCILAGYFGILARPNRIEFRTGNYAFMTACKNLVVVPK